MNKKRLFIFMGILVFVFISYEVYSFVPKPIISKPYKVDKLEFEIKKDENNRIISKSSSGYSGDDDAVGVESIIYNDEDVTEKIDAEALVVVLSNTTIKRTLKEYTPYQSSDIAWEIHLLYNNKPMHLLLGKFNTCYGLSDTTYEIQEPKLIKQTLMDMIAK